MKSNKKNDKIKKILGASRVVKSKNRKSKGPLDHLNDLITWARNRFGV